MSEYVKRNLSLSNRRQLKENAMKALNGKYQYIAEISTGAYGDVLVLWSKQDHCKIAAKIIDPSLTPEGELELWPQFNHPNVLPLLECIRQPNADIFLMPFYPKSLVSVLSKKQFHSNPDSLKMIKEWLTDVLLGLEYMHEQGVCHLDLRASNILMSTHHTAIICDFNSATKYTGKTDKYVLPTYYCPPEAWPVTLNGPRPKADGLGIDIWALGMLILYCFSNGWFESQLWGHAYWWDDMYPLMFKCLEFPFLYSLMTKSYPTADISCETCAYAVNLLKGIFRYQPQQRPNTTEILQHVLFCSPGHALLKPDPMWSTMFDLKRQRLVIRSKLRSIMNNALTIANGLLNDRVLETENHDKDTDVPTERRHIRSIRGWFGEKCRAMCCCLYCKENNENKTD